MTDIDPKHGVYKHEIVAKAEELLASAMTIDEWQEKLHALNVKKGFHENPGTPPVTIDTDSSGLEIMARAEEAIQNACSINPSGRTIWTMLGNIVCEVSEAWEEVREGAFDLSKEESILRWETDKYGNDKPEGLGPELADILIRTLDTAAALNIDLERMVAIKNVYNESRKSKHGGKRI